VAQRPVRGGKLREQVALGADQVGEVVWMLAEERLVDDRAGAARLAAVAEGLVDGLSAGQALHVRILGGVLGGGGRGVERLAVPLESPLEVGPSVRLE